MALPSPKNFGFAPAQPQEPQGLEVMVLRGSERAAGRGFGVLAVSPGAVSPWGGVPEL